VTAEAIESRPAGAPIRDWWERAVQTLCYEVGGLLVIAPIWKFATDDSATESAFLLICLSVAVMIWMAAYNTIFDVVEYRVTGLVASIRPHRRRIVHALGLEASSVIVTWPLVMLVTGFTWLEALGAEVGLTLAYAVYSYLYHLGFDRLRPVQQSLRRPPAQDDLGHGAVR
jgi:uncharacterized membrane protein